MGKKNGEGAEKPLKCLGNPGFSAGRPGSSAAAEQGRGKPNGGPDRQLEWSNRKSVKDEPGSFLGTGGGIGWAGVGEDTQRGHGWWLAVDGGERGWRLAKKRTSSPRSPDNGYPGRRQPLEDRGVWGALGKGRGNV